MAKGNNSKTYINGFEYGWANITMLINNTALTGITAINYEETAEKEAIFGVGRTMVAYGIGNYVASSDITVHGSEIIALQDSARKAGIEDGDIMGLTPFDIIVAYDPSEGQGTPIFDILHNCVFTKNTRSIAQGDKVLEIGLDILCSHITWGEQ